MTCLVININIKWLHLPTGRFCMPSEVLRVPKKKFTSSLVLGMSKLASGRKRLLNWSMDDTILWQCLTQLLWQQSFVNESGLKWKANLVYFVRKFCSGCISRKGGRIKMQSLCTKYGPTQIMKRFCHGRISSQINLVKSQFRLRNDELIFKPIKFTIRRAFKHCIDSHIWCAFHSFLG